MSGGVLDEAWPNVGQRDDVRAEVRAFALAMEAKLRANDHKRHWRNFSAMWLMHRLEQEVGELRRALMECRSEDVEGEAADVANFAMMIADLFKKYALVERRTRGRR